MIRGMNWSPQVQSRSRSCVKSRHYPAAGRGTCADLTSSGRNRLCAQALLSYKVCVQTFRRKAVQHKAVTGP